MSRQIKIGRHTVKIEENLLDRAINYLSPAHGARRLRGRMFEAMSGFYTGASKSRRATSEWNPITSDPDSENQWERTTLVERSRDLMRNAPLALGAVNTNVTNVVGSGLTLDAQIDRAILNMTDEQAEEWEAVTEAEWSLFWDTKDVDIQRTLTGPALTEMAFRQTLIAGEIFINFARVNRDGPYGLALQLVEADRVCNKDNSSDTDTLFQGIEKDANGAPLRYHVCSQFPYSYRVLGSSPSWQVVPAYSTRTGLPNLIHLFRPLRPGQSRGLPYITPVIESLKQLDRYTEAELMAAVISSMFTVFIKTEAGDSSFGVGELGVETGATASGKDIKLASGSIIDLAQGESIETANPTRPNAGFDPFVMSILQQVGVALELPFEVLIKHFTASYSAARGALLEAWKYFISRRAWLADNFMREVYRVWLYEAIASGRISAPGYFADPLIRKAYSGSDWIGPPQGHIDPSKEITAAKERMGACLTTHAQETAALGGDWERNIRQIGKEVQQIRQSGMTILTNPAPISREPEDDRDQPDNQGGKGTE